MKARNRSTKKGTAAEPARASVRLEYTHPSATCVCIAGSFNDWHPSATEMVPLGSGRWVKDIVLKPGRYEYRFVVDGVWTSDPAATGSVPNPFGGDNSVVEVPEIG